MGDQCIHLPVVGYIYFRERERERERERVSSACGGIWVFIIYRRKVSVLFGCIGEQGIHLPVVGYIYISEREREREKRERERERERKKKASSTMHQIV